jgi:UDP-2-acetamido-3-amino-2,3-dideoxy-glucuronate N-acetyltransferase
MIAQVGAGYWGKNLVRNFSELGSLAAIVDVNSDHSAIGGLASKFGVQVRTLGDVLSDRDIKALSIATPASTHANIALEALECGKSVFIEKPLALDIEDAEKLVTKADASSLTLMVGHLLRYHPVFEHLLELVRAGLIGKIQHIYSNRLSLGKIRTEENVWWSFAPHDISMIHAITEQEPEKVTAQGYAHLNCKLFDWATAQLVFPDGMCAHINVSWMHPFKEHKLVVTGSEGSLAFEDSESDWDKKLKWFKHRVAVNNQSFDIDKTDAEYISVQKGEPLKNECEHFLQCITNNSLPKTDGKEGLSVLRTLKRCHQQMTLSEVS